MGEVEGSYRAIQTPGTRLGAQFNAGISTLEPGQSLGDNMASGAKSHGRGLQIRVMGLDDSQEFYNLEPKAIGQTLLSQVFQRVNLIESDYFGLEFQNIQMNWVWLEPTKPIVRQMRRPANTLIRLAVKFFPPDPGQLQEEYTRYLFSLQMKRDLTEGRLICTENTGALLASHLIQSEIGDYEDIADRDFLRLNEFLPYQEKVQEKIMELHRRHQGHTPAESDFQVLEIARKLEMYGVRYHPAADREGTKIHLAVAHMGLQVFQGNTKINTFNWSKIRKLSFKRKRFLIKLHPEVHGPHQDTLEFMMASRDQCKIFWKNCVEHHSFFRLFDQPQPKAKAILFTRGSSFRYSGRTQKQLVEYVRDSGTKHTPYERRNSKIRMSARSLAADVPKQCLSFNDSLRSPFPPSPATVSFHSSSYLFSGSHPQRTVGLQAPPPLSLSPPTPSPQLARTPPRAARPPSPPKEEEEVEEVVVAALEEEEAAVKGNRYTSQGAPSYQAAGQHCGPLFVCVDSSVSQIAQASLQNGNEDRGVSGTSRWSPGGLGTAGWSPGGLETAGWSPGGLGTAGWSPGGLGTAGWSPGGLETAGWSPGGLGTGGWSSGGSGTGGWSVGGLRKGMLTPEAFEAELMRVKQNAAPAFLPAGGGPPLQISEEFIDDDPAEMSFYAGGAEAYAPGLGDKAGPCGGGFGGVSGGLYGLGLEDLNGNRNPFSGGRSETSSLANNRSGSSSLDNLGLSSAGECLSGGYGVPLSSSSSPSLLLRRLPGSDFPSEASSMVNFPACSVRSDASSAVQFSDLVEQLELLSCPPTATEGSASGSSDSESDWGSEGSLPPEQSLFYSNPLTGMGGDGGIEGFLLQCQNLRALALADPPTTATGSPHV